MKLVIDIPCDDYTQWKQDGWIDATVVRDALVNCTPLPKGHGRLIDANKFIKKVNADRKHSCYVKSWTADDVLFMLGQDYAPTIIEADKEEE